MTRYTCRCLMCDREYDISHQGPRVESKWILIRGECPICDYAEYYQTYDGPKPRQKIQKKSLILQRAILEYFAREGDPLTVRRLYYIAETEGLVPKDDSGYNRIQRQTKVMRKHGSLPFSWIADNHRWVSKPRTYSEPMAALNNTQRFYRKNLWEAQNAYVEIWVEKDSMAGVLSPITREFDVPLYPARGFSSMTFIYEAAESIKASGKPAYIYHFGDFDKYGIEAAQTIARDLQEEHGLSIHFERVAVTLEQIESLGLSTRKPKQKWAYDFAVELEAMPTPFLRHLVRACITRHIDTGEWGRLQTIEQAEKKSLKEFISGFNTSPKTEGKPLVR